MDAAPDAPSLAPVVRGEVPDAALDAVAAIVRALAETAVRTPDAADRLEAWARHILVLTPSPDVPQAADPDRDWIGLSSHVVGHVRNDHTAVSRSIDDLQDAVWLVIERLSLAVVGDAASDALAADQLAQLRVAAGGSAAELKATAMQTVERLSEIIDEKSQRQLELARELGKRVDTLSVELEDTRRDKDIDPLTDLGNRGVFQRELPRAVQVRTLTDEPSCLILIDIDHFKHINDLHGHAAGDSALVETARTLVHSFPRRADVVARIGGDEFAVILRDADASDGDRLARRFAAAVQELEVLTQGDNAKVTVSVGVAESHPGEAADGWFARADRALYQAKADGRNRVAIAEVEPSDLAQVSA